jgi:hypothetical protein
VEGIMGYEELWVTRGLLKIEFKKTRKNQKKSEKYLTTLDAVTFILKKKQLVKIVSFMFLVSSN